MTLTQGCFWPVPLLSRLLPHLGAPHLPVGAPVGLQIPQGTEQGDSSLQVALCRIINFWAPQAGNGLLLMGSLRVPARSDLRIRRFINITSNLSSLMGKFCQHLIKSEIHSSLVPTRALSLSSAVSRKLVQQPAMGLMKM